VPYAAAGIRKWGHTVFTDHRIRKTPQQPAGTGPLTELIAWREPALEFRERNLALAFNNAGLHYTSLDLLARSYEMLLELQKKFPADPDILTALGTVLLNRNDFVPAARLFDRVIELRPNDPSSEDNAAMAWLGAGDKEAATRHFEKALVLDPLLIPDIEALLRIFREAGDHAKETALMERVRQAMRTGPRAAPAR
jgi:tetratricopeptide (TPR) repeat protein